MPVRNRLPIVLSFAVAVLSGLSGQARGHARTHVYQVAGTPLTFSVSAPPELDPIVHTASARVREALAALGHLNAASMPPGSWRVHVRISRAPGYYEIHVGTDQVLSDESRPWARARYRVAGKEVLSEVLEQAIRLAVPLQGVVAAQDGDTWRVEFPAMESWAWGPDPRLEPHRGVLLASGAGGVNFSEGIIACCDGDQVWISPRSGTPPSRGTAVIVPPVGESILQLRVVGKGGAPLPGAIVRMKLSGGDDTERVMLTDRTGRCSYVAPAGMCLQLSVEYPGIRARLWRVAYLARHDADIVLAAGSERVLVIARAHRLLEEVRRFQGERQRLIAEIADAMEEGDADRVESLVADLARCAPDSQAWEGELVLIKEAADRAGEKIAGILAELRHAISVAGQMPDLSRYREWVAARRRQLKVEELSRRAQELTEQMQWEELAECYEELAAITDDGDVQRRLRNLRRLLQLRGPEHEVARAWVNNWVRGASLQDVRENSDVLELTVSQLVSARDSLYLLIVHRALERWTDELAAERERLQQQAQETGDPGEQRRVGSELQELAELATSLASLAERIAPLIRDVSL